MISEKELLEMKSRLSADVVDDAEELLMWFAIHGIELIDEVLSNRDARRNSCPACAEYAYFEE